MRAGQSKRCGVVVKGRGTPGRHRVARHTCGRETGRDVRGIGGRVKIPLVALYALRRGSLELISHVTAGAGHRRVRPCQGETGEGVIELPAPPDRIHSVADNAVCPEARLSVGRRERGFVLLPVAGIAVCWNPPIFVPLLAHVTIPAGCRAVRPQKGKSGL